MGFTPLGSEQSGGGFTPLDEAGGGGGFTPLGAAEKPLQAKMPKGMLEFGTLDPASMPVVRNEDGTVSTMRSMSINVDGREILIPTMHAGRRMTEQEAIQKFRVTGEHLGVFKDHGSATSYAKWLSNSQGEALDKAGVNTGSKGDVGNWLQRQGVDINKSAIPMPSMDLDSIARRYHSQQPTPEIRQGDFAPVRALKGLARDTTQVLEDTAYAPMESVTMAGDKLVQAGLGAGRMYADASGNTEMQKAINGLQQGHAMLVQGDRQSNSHAIQMMKEGASSLLALLPARVMGATGAGMAVGAAGMAGLPKYQEARANGLGIGESIAFAGGHASLEFLTELAPMKILFDIGGDDAIKRVLKAFLPELAGEQLATASQDALDFMYLKPEATFSDYMKSRGEGFVDTLWATVGGLGTGGAMQAGVEGAKSDNRRMSEAFRDIEQGTGFTPLTEEQVQTAFRGRPQDAQHGAPTQGGFTPLETAGGGADPAMGVRGHTAELSPDTAQGLSPVHDYVTPEDASARLNRAINRAPEVGAPVNQRTILQDDTGPYAVGQITHQDWVDRVLAYMSPEEIKQARGWYKQLHNTLGPIFGPQTERVALAWLISQQRASPSQGMMNVLRALDIAAGKAKVKQAGLSEAAMLKALRGEVPDGGLEAKLLDFIDSEMGFNTRTVMGRDPRGGQPAVVDVWGFRDVGRVDQTTYDYLKKRFGDQAVANLQVEPMSGEAPYEYGSRFYNDLVGTLNQQGFDGGNWEGREAQAVGWTAMQAAMGTKAETVGDIIGNNTRKISVGLSPGAGSIYDGKIQEFDPAIAEEIINEIADLAGVHILNEQAGIGAYQQWVEGAIRVDTLASPEGIQDFMDMLGYAFGQTEVIGTRPKLSGKNTYIDILGEGLEDPTGAKWLFDAILKAQGMLGGKQLVEGFQQVSVDGQPGIRIINFGGKWGEAKVSSIYAVINEAAKAVGMDVHAVSGVMEMVNAKNDWKENPDGRAYLDSLNDRGRLREAAELVRRDFSSRLLSREGQRAASAAEPATEQSSDLDAQFRWLTEVAKKNGFASVDEMSAKAPDLFKSLAAEWRKSHPMQDPAQGLAEEIRQEVEYMRQEAEKQLDAYKAMLQDMASATGTSVLMPPPGYEIKSTQRAGEKVEGDYNGDAKKLTDLLRGSLIADTPEALQNALRALQAVGPIKLKDFVSQPTPLGYAAIISVVDVNGVKAEVQIVPKQIQEVKDRVHKQYERFQDLERAPHKTGGMLFEMEQLRDYLVGEFAPAINAWNSASEISRDSMPMVENLTGASPSGQNAVQTNSGVQATGTSQSKNLVPGGNSISTSNQAATGTSYNNPVYGAINVTDTALPGYSVQREIPRDLSNNGWMHSTMPAEWGNTISAALNDLVAAGMPRPMAHAVAGFGTYSAADPNFAKVYPAQRIIGVRQDIMQDIASGNVETKTKLRSWLAHEIAHTVDMTQNTPDSSIAAHSPRMVRGGDIWDEAWGAWLSDKQGDLTNFLNYPFATFNPDSNAARSELFAQLSALYFTSPALMQENLPVAFKAMEAIYEQGQDVARLRQGLRKTLRASAPVVRAGDGVRNENDRGGGRGIEAGRADRDTSGARLDDGPGNSVDAAQGVSDNEARAEELIQKFGLAVTQNVSAKANDLVTDAVRQANGLWEQARGGTISHGTMQSEAERLASLAGWSVHGMQEMLQQGTPEGFRPVDLLGAALATSRVHAVKLITATSPGQFTKVASELVNLMVATRVMPSEAGRLLGHYGWLMRNGVFSDVGEGGSTTQPKKTQPGPSSQAGKASSAVQQAQSAVSVAKDIVGDTGVTEAEMEKALGGEKGVQKVMNAIKAQGKDLDLNMLVQYLSSMADTIASDKANKATIVEMVLEQFQAFILTGMFTHAVNVTSNAANMMLEFGIVQPLRGLVGGPAGVRGVLAGYKEFGGFRKLLSDIYAVMGYNAFEEAPASRLAHLLSQRDQDLIRLMLDDTGGKYTDKRKAIPGGWGKFVRTFGFVPLGVEDALFKVIPYRFELARQEAAGEPRDVKAALEFAKYLTFQSDTWWTGWLSQLTHRHPSLKAGGVLFVRTMMGLLNRSLELTPGTSQVILHRELMGKEGKAKAQEAWAKTLAGILLSLMVMDMGCDDESDDYCFTGYNPSDWRKRAVAEIENGEISWRMNGKVYPLYRLSPVAEVIGINLGIKAAIQDGKVGELANAYWKAIITKHFLKTLSDSIDTMENMAKYNDERPPETTDETKEFGYKVAKGAAGFAYSTVIPNLLPQLGDLTDKEMRVSRTILEDLQRRIPGLRERLDPKLRVTGEVMANDRYMSPYPVLPRAVKKDEVARWLLKNGRGIDPDPKSIKMLPSAVKQTLLKERWQYLGYAQEATKGMSREDQLAAINIVLQRWGRYAAEQAALQSGPPTPTP